MPPCHRADWRHGRGSAQQPPDREAAEAVGGAGCSYRGAAEAIGDEEARELALDC